MKIVYKVDGYKIKIKGDKVWLNGKPMTEVPHHMVQLIQSLKFVNRSQLICAIARENNHV